VCAAVFAGPSCFVHSVALCNGGEHLHSLVSAQPGHTIPSTVGRVAGGIFRSWTAHSNQRDQALLLSKPGERISGESGFGFARLCSSFVENLDFTASKVHGRKRGKTHVGRTHLEHPPQTQDPTRVQECANVSLRVCRAHGVRETVVRWGEGVRFLVRVSYFCASTPKTTPHITRNLSPGLLNRSGFLHSDQPTLQAREFLPAWPSLRQTNDNI